MKLGITGTRGFIGTNFLLHLDAIGFPYVIMEGDIFEKYTSDAITHIIHLAGRTSSAEKLYLSDYIRDNVMLAAKIMDFAKQIQASVVVFSSYGYHPCQSVPPSDYYLSKAMLEDMASYYAYQFGLNIQVLRLGSVFGRYQNQASLLSNILSQIKGPNKTIYLRNLAALRSYISVKDVIEFIILVLDRKVRFEIHFVGARDLLSVKEFAESVMQAMNCTKEIELITNDINQVLEDCLIDAINQNILMGNQLSWMPKHSLAKGLSDTLL
jgi:nucleoside-diphosphate-sugar epimerase